MASQNSRDWSFGKSQDHVLRIYRLLPIASRQQLDNKCTTQRVTLGTEKGNSNFSIYLVTEKAPNTVLF